MIPSGLVRAPPKVPHCTSSHRLQRSPNPVFFPATKLQLDLYFICKIPASLELHFWHTIFYTSPWKGSTLPEVCKTSIALELQHLFRKSVGTSPYNLGGSPSDTFCRSLNWKCHPSGCGWALVLVGGVGEGMGCPPNQPHIFQTPWGT